MERAVRPRRRQAAITRRESPPSTIMDFRKLITRRKASPAVLLLRGALRILSVPYAAAAQLKNCCYDMGLKDVYRSSLPTISVGNLSVGGTGKSPVVAWLARQLRQKGIRVAILSRGYGQLDSGRNDEALELEVLLPDVPHLQHRDRSASARLAEEELDMQCLLLDDAFQHRRIARDLDIVLIDATDPPSAQHPLPGGLYREAFRNLRRADIVIISRSDQAKGSELQRLENRVARHAPTALLVKAKHGPSDLFSYPDTIQPPSALKGRPILAFCGIGNPDAFFATLVELGASVLATKTFPDHHAYSRDDVDKLDRWVRSHPQAEMVLCTMKDSVKIQTSRTGGLPLAALRVELTLSANDQSRVLEQIDEVLVRYSLLTSKASVNANRIDDL